MKRIVIGYTNFNDADYIANLISDYFDAKKITALALILSYMCIATACAGSTNMDYAADNPSTSERYLNSVTEGTDRNGNNQSSVTQKAGNLIDDAGRAAGNMLDHAGDTAGDVVQDAANGVSNLTNDVFGSENANTTSTRTR